MCAELSWNLWNCPGIRMETLQLLGFYWDLSGTLLEISAGVDNKTELIKRKDLDSKSAPNQAL